jgi:hypothetical protein
MRQYVSTLTAKAEMEEPQSKNIHYKSSKSSENMAVKNISVEEWDCPKPGSKKYMPKTVKENIKKNFKKINSASDSLSLR